MLALYTQAGGDANAAAALYLDSIGKDAGGGPAGAPLEEELRAPDTQYTQTLLTATAAPAGADAATAPAPAARSCSSTSSSILLQQQLVAGYEWYVVQQLYGESVVRKPQQKPGLPLELLMCCRSSHKPAWSSRRLCWL
ncbi:hypothetical protein ACSSS7_008090 [Eimeria intestinalis]